MANSDKISTAQRAAKLIQSAETAAEERDFPTADKLFLEALELDASASNRIAYGVYLAHQERYFAAISIFTAVMDGTDRDAIGVVYHNLAAIYREVGDDDLARRFQWRATLTSDDSGSEELLGMANDALVNNHFALAGTLANSAVELQTTTEEEQIDPDLLATMGLVEAASGSVEHGVLALFSAFRQHRENRDVRGMATDQLNLSVLFGKLNRHRAERACLLRAMRYFEQVPAPHSYQRTRQQLGRFDRMQAVRSFDSRRN